MELNLTYNGAGERLDSFISSEVLDFSRAEIQDHIKSGQIRVNNQEKKPSYKLAPGDRIEGRLKKYELELIPEDIKLDLLYEDEDLLVINKPKGLVVHPGAGNPKGTLANGLVYNYPKLLSLDPIRPGIVHRLDKDTSGALVVAKNIESYDGLIDLFKDRSIKRTYIALVHGRPRDHQASIEGLISRSPKNRQKMAIVERGGKYSKTNYRLIEDFGDYSLLELDLITGRTHQIRVHMAHIGHPIVGDLVYGRSKSNLGHKTQMLHSEQISFIHPISGYEISLIAPAPLEFRETIEKLRRKKDGS